MRTTEVKEALPESPLAGRRILVVEDESYVALLLEDMLSEIGCEVVAMAATVEEGVALARTLTVDAAVLDVNVAGREVFPVAESLRERRIPLVFSTGYGAAAIPAHWTGAPTLAKPYATSLLEEALRRILGYGPGRAGPGPRRDRQPGAQPSRCAASEARAASRSSETSASRRIMR